MPVRHELSVLYHEFVINATNYQEIGLRELDRRKSDAGSGF
jgi:hypothetical protein